MSRSVKKFFSWKINCCPVVIKDWKGSSCAVMIGRPVVEIVCGRCFVEFVNFG